MTRWPYFWNSNWLKWNFFALNLMIFCWQKSIHSWKRQLLKNIFTYQAVQLTVWFDGMEKNIENDMMCWIEKQVNFNQFLCLRILYVDWHLDWCAVHQPFLLLVFCAFFDTSDRNDWESHGELIGILCICRDELKSNENFDEFTYGITAIAFFSFWTRITRWTWTNGIYISKKFK